MKSQQERSLVEDTFTRSSVIDENERRIYEVNEEPEDRPRRRSKMPGKYSDFVMNSAKNRQIRVTSKSEVTRSLSKVMPPNGRIVPRMLRPASELHHTKEESAARKEKPEKSDDSKEEDESPERSPKQATGDTARKPATSTRVTSPPVIPPTEGRKPVRPRLPTVRSIRSTIEAPQPLPKMPQQEARKRRTVITTDRLAKAASENPSKSTQELADELTAEYSLTPEERRRCLHILRGMRVAQRHLCGRIRRAFPMTNGAEEHQEFLGWLQTTMREVEGRDSDELP